MIDLAVAITPFLDVTFVGLSELPTAGQERFATQLLRSPGGGAITATGAARLGLSTALAAPLGADEAGAQVGRALEEEGVTLVAPHEGSTAITVVLPVDGDRAMVTYDSGARARPEDLEALAPRAVIAAFDALDQLPAGAWGYASLGDAEAHPLNGTVPAGLERARAVFANEEEALRLTGAPTGEAAADALGEMVESAVVTLGPRGAVAVSGGERAYAPGIDTGPAIDTTGAGDLFAAAYIWGDLRGADPEARLRWAVLYAALSVRCPTGVAGAVQETVLIEEGARRGLPEPPGSSAVSSALRGKERE